MDNTFKDTFKGQIILNSNTSSYFQGSNFLKFLLEAAPEHYHSEGFDKRPVWQKFGPSFFTTVFVSRLCLINYYCCPQAQYNDPSIQMIEAAYLVRNTAKSIMYQVEPWTTYTYLQSMNSSIYFGQKPAEKMNHS